MIKFEIKIVLYIVYEVKFVQNFKQKKYPKDIICWDIYYKIKFKYMYKLIHTDLFLRN